jgi:4-amino-4-deoxy-L-arabinose transferase-like glycosyltransferase
MPFSKISNSKKRILEYLSLALILMLATVLSCYRIAEPAWDDTHGKAPLDGFHGSILAEYGRIAQNYLKFGYLRTKLGQTTNYGWVEPSESFRYRFDHPALSPWLISVAFRLFGIHEWSARLVFVLSSLATLSFVFLLVRRLARDRTALLASLLLSLTPMYIYYGKMPDKHFLATLFSLLTFFFYYCWIETRKGGYYLGMYVSFVLGTFADWIAYFVVPPILLHYIVYEYRKTRDLKFVFSFAILPFVLFGAHLGWAYLLEGKEVVKELLDLFLFRSVSAGSLRGKITFTWWDLYASGYTRSRLFLTSTVLLLSTVGSITLVARLFRKESSRQNAFVLSLFLFGLSHNLIFRNRVFVHDYIMLFHLLPFFAIAAALGVEFIIERVLLNRTIWVVPFVLIVCCSLAFQLTAALRTLYRASVLPDLYLIGTQISALTDETAKVMAPFALDYRMGFYADRPWTVTTDLDTLVGLSHADSRYSLYVSDSESTERIDGNLKEHLVRTYPVETFYGYSFFNLREAGSNTILTNPQIERRAEVNFDDKLMFLGYNVEEVVRKKREPSWLEKYFKGPAELLPEHRTTFRITYFWRCLEEMEKDYTLLTQFEGHHGQIYRIDQSHQGVNGVYPTSLWPKGEIIREEYEVEVPNEYPPIRYALSVGVRNGEEELSVSSEVETDESNRVKVGEIEVAPAERAVGLAKAPAVATKLEIPVGDEILFLGYDLNKANLTPGDKLRIVTSWQSLKQTGRDYAISLEVRNDNYKVSQVLDIAPTRVWEGGKYYRAETVIPLNPHILDGTYSLNLYLDGDQLDTRIELTTLDIHSWQRRHITRRVGKADYRGSEIISPDEPLSLRFHLKERGALEVVAGWTGKARGEETRVELYITNAYLRERYVGTWVVESGDYLVTKWKIGRVLTASGENVLELRVPKLREKVHNVGWRGVVDLVFPDLLQDPRTDYDGPIQMDFAQVSTRWGGDWDDYFDLAKVYAERGMQGEVVRLYEEVVDKGVEPGRVDDLALFKGTYVALGEEGKAGEIEERIAGRIAYKMSVNLGGKVEFLGHSLRGEERNGHGLSLFFRCLEEMEEDYTLWVHGEVEDESLLEGHRREARYAVFDHLLPTSRWRVGEVYQDDEVRGLRPGRYHFTLGLWRPEDGSRLWREDDPGAHVIDLGWVEAK